MCGLVLFAIVSIRKRLCVQGAALEMWYRAEIEPLMCRTTTELKPHLLAGLLLFLRREHRSYSHELTDILSQRVKVSISCDKHSAAWGKGNKIMYVCGTLSSRVIKIHLYISIFCSNWRAVYTVFLRLTSIAMCRFIHLLVALLPRQLCFWKETKSSGRGEPWWEREELKLSSISWQWSCYSHFAEQKTVPRAEKSMVLEVLIKHLETHSNLW